jgi:hypothetical protein
MPFAARIARMIARDSASAAAPPIWFKLGFQRDADRARQAVVGRLRDLVGLRTNEPRVRGHDPR